MRKTIVGFLIAAALFASASLAQWVPLNLSFGVTPGTVASNAVTTDAYAGVITDDSTDINADTTRADITWTNNKITTTSVILFSECKKPTDANVNIVARVTRGSGTATLSLRNTGTGNLTTNGDAVICFLVIPQ